MIENLKAEEKAKLKALRDTVQIRIDDIEARTFKTPEALRGYFMELCEEAIKKKPFKLAAEREGK